MCAGLPNPLSYHQPALLHSGPELWHSSSQVCLACDNPNNTTMLRDGKCVAPCKDPNCQACPSPDADTCDKCFGGERSARACWPPEKHNTDPMPP